MAPSSAPAAAPYSTRPNSFLSERRLAALHRSSRSACDRCVSRKVKCDSVRPECTRCAQRAVPCTYSEPDQISPRPDKSESAEDSLADNTPRPTSSPAPSALISLRWLAPLTSPTAAKAKSFPVEAIQTCDLFLTAYIMRAPTSSPVDPHMVIHPTLASVFPLDEVTRWIRDTDPLQGEAWDSAGCKYWMDCISQTVSRGIVHAAQYRCRGN